ncbi:hypothetical protein PWG15_12485 [Ensifer adhaerens]|uniref:hypothetical protein n=1 Tax=Ensifer adhaerens TaxID=106592 RepID=UPI0023A9A2B9|nr:hypothetical protein [Ensifer adhaerens]WDZ75434.1 hypothetical protein PWG15_12485 [Ensifer adhaerens]
MSSTTRQMALLPHEMNEIDQIFQDVLRERGLSRDCETAEAIARRILNCYQKGIRESAAVKCEIGLERRAQANAGMVDQVNPEVSMQEIAAGPTVQISPDELDMLQRTFDRVCIWCSIPRYGKRAERLAWHITDQFRKGMTDEAALFDSAMWLERISDSARNRPDA